MKKTIKSVFLLLVGSAFTFFSCQKMDRPALGNYPKDANPPGGPLKFYAAFDGTTTNVLMNAVDSIRANFPSNNPFTPIDGVNGKALQGVSNTYVKYPSFNDWASSSSVTISFWSKGASPTVGNEGGNSPNHVISFPATSGYPHWSGSVMMLFLESSSSGCQVKWMVVTKNVVDNWFTWEDSNGGTIPGVLDNLWHHFVLKYDETSSTAYLYIDGVQNAMTHSWASHGPLNLDVNYIGEYRVGKGPLDNGGNDWQSGSFQRGLDQLRLYGVALSDAEISALYTGKK